MNPYQELDQQALADNPYRRLDNAQSGFFPTIKRTGGQMLSGAGIATEDIAGKNVISDYLRRKGEDIVAENPAAITSLRDIVDKPWETVKEATGQMVPQIGAGIIGRVAGGALGGRAFGPGGAVIGGIAGALAPIFVQEYGGIREDQQAQGINDKGRALLAAGAATGLEMLGPEGRLISKGLQPAAGRTLRDIGKGALKDVVVEGTTEALQTPIEQIGAYRNPLTPESLEETAVSGIMGGIGGGIVGGGRRAVEAFMQPPATELPPGPPLPDGGNLPPSLDGGGMPPFTPPPVPVATPPAGPLSQAAEVAAATGATKPAVPFVSEAAAQKQADALAAATGQPHAAGPHPTVQGRFAALPAEAFTPPGTPTEAEKSAQLDQLQRDSQLPKAEFDAGLTQAMTGGEPLQTQMHQKLAEAMARKKDEAARQQIDAVANEAATSPLNDLAQPTEKQKSAGNYRLGHPKPQLIQGLNISIENPAGSTRSGVDADGKPWEHQLPAHYGYIRRTEAADGDKLDVYLGPYPGRPTVFVVDQNNPKTGQFDEHKAMVGFDNINDAEAAYRAAYGADWPGFGAITPMPMADFKQWIKDPANLKAPLQKGIDHAETLPIDAGQIRSAGDELASGENQGGENLQFDQEAQRSQALQQTGAAGIDAGLQQVGLGETTQVAAAAVAPPTAPTEAPAAAATETESGLRYGKYVTDAPEVEHITQKGKKLTGVIARGVSLEEAKEADPFAFRKDGGVFIRMAHVERLDVAKATTPLATDERVQRYAKRLREIRPESTESDAVTLAIWVVRAIDSGRYNIAMDPANSDTRQLFTELTGVKLLPSEKATRALFKGVPFNEPGEAKRTELETQGAQPEQQTLDAKPDVPTVTSPAQAAAAQDPRINDWAQRLMAMDSRFHLVAAQKTAVRVAQVIDDGLYDSVLHPDNKNARRLFTDLTGVKLLPTISGMMKQFTGSPFALKGETKPATPAVTKPAQGKSEWTEIGENADGHTLYEDGNGVRAYLADGIRHSEAVTLRPTRQGIKTEVDVEHREARFKTRAETAPVERRKDLAKRQRVADMSVAEMRRELLVDALTGLGNRRAYDEAAKLKYQASLDVDALKWVNDNLGHAAGDDMLRIVGQALADETAHAFHISGDEFIAQADDAAALTAALDAARARLAGAVLEGTNADGSSWTVKGVGYSYGIGTTLNEAEHGLQRQKQAREATGERPARGTAPRGAVESGRRGQGQPADQDHAATEKTETRLDTPPTPPSPAAEANTEKLAQRQQRRREAEREIFDAVQQLPAVLNAVKNSDQQNALIELRAQVEKYLAQQLAQAAAAGDADRVHAFDDARYALQSQPKFYLAAYRAVQKRQARLDLETKRDPAVYQAAFAAAAAQDSMGDDPYVLAAYKAGWDHALAGKTRSTLTGDRGAIRDHGYMAAQAWIRDGAGRDYLDGKRPAKLQNTGADLRRWLDTQKANMAAASQSDGTAAWNAIEVATTRADIFNRILPADATPGAQRYVDLMRNLFLPFKEWLVEYGPLRPAIGAWTKVGSEKIRLYIAGDSWLPDQRTATLDQRLTLLRNAADDYLDHLGALVEALAGSKTVAQLADGFAAAAYTDKKMNELGDALFNLARSGYTSSFTNLLPTGYQVEYLIEHEHDVSTTADKKKLIPPRLDRVVRQGLPDWRQGKDVTPEEFKTTFGFADVGFGKWVGAKQDQDHLNYAYDAFRDLAEQLDMPPAGIGLGGTLHFTIGALGHGKFAAHFQPQQSHPDGGTVPVINLTNTRGDGTVAHEWLHALDFHLRAKQSQVLDEILRQLKFRFDFDAVVKGTDRMLRGVSYMQGAKSQGPVANAKRGINYFSTGDQQISDYRKNADALGKDYWGNDRELFARAGEAWLSDRLKGTNNYLVNPNWVGEGMLQPPLYRGIPYPTGAERGRFGRWYDALFRSLQWDGNAPTINGSKWKTNKPSDAEDFRAALKQLEDSLDDRLAAIQQDDKFKTEQRQREREAAEQAARDAAAAALRDQLASAPAPAAPASGPLDEDDLSRLFDEAAAELRESQQESPDTPSPGLPSLQTTPPKRQPKAKPQTDAATASETSAAKLAAEAAKLGVKGIDETLKGLVELFGKGRIQSFPGGFDAEAYAKAKPHFEAALQAFQAAGKTLKDLFKFLIGNFGEGIKPYAIKFAEDKQLSAQLGAQTSATQQIAHWVRDQLQAGRSISATQLFAEADRAYGGSQAEGRYTVKDAYDALEAGINLSILASSVSPAQDNAEQAKREIRDLGALVQRVPTQTKRTAEMDEFQQFSTPPAFAYAANWVANIRPGDVMLEPSAGIAGLAVFARNAGASVVLNELSSRRAEVLRLVLPDAQLFSENAEQLDNILPEHIKPSVVVMNPPFSATAGRVEGQRDSSNGARHIEQALARLAPGGRLVAIVGQGMASDRPAFRNWWASIGKQYAVRANIGVSGQEYAKYGTTFDNQLLVIDKVTPDGKPPVTGKVDRIEALIDQLQGVRNERASPSQQVSPQPASDPLAQGVAGGLQPAGGNAAGDIAGTGDRPPVPTADPGNLPPAAAAGVGAGKQPGSRVRRASGTGATDASGTLPDSDKRPGSDVEPTPPGSRSRSEVTLDANVEPAPVAELGDAVFERYRPQKLAIAGAREHPGALVQSAAMASVEPPAASYVPNLPKDVITEGKLSLAQLEAVVYAGQAHSQALPDGERRGYFIGDGTGVGKGREIAGIILDNWRQGRQKAVWISEKQPLVKDAQRDFGGIGGDPALIFPQLKVDGGKPISAPHGIVFSTYKMISDGSRPTKPGVTTTKPTRFDQLVNWLGADFDGVIAFDEAHNAGNALAMKGDRGVKEASQRALAVVELQKRLPKARVVYISATGATEVSNLSYATRLGLWGKGTPFESVKAFVGQIEQGGLAAMELVARDMKQMGVYLSRNLSYDGVTFSRLEHQLTPIQTEMYNELARAWQVVLTNIHAALEATGVTANGRNLNGLAKGAAMAKFWGGHQRFFNQVITAMQMPSVLDQMHADLNAGKSVVLQLVNTNEAVQERQLATRENKDSEDLEDLDLTPREQLLQYLKNSFPVAEFEQYTDDSGNTRARPVVDSQGNPVESKAALALRERLIDNVQAVRVPEGPLEMVLNEFGGDAVAEVTGRRQRVVRVKDSNGQEKTIVEKRGPLAAQTDAQAFQNGKKRILIFSDAGGTGYSFQSDLTAANQQRRMHYLVQAGWRADKAIQGFGRTHRTNQANAPHYYLVSTDLPAQKRFISSIARRMDQVGALTKGQRDTTNQGLFSEKDNLEGRYASEAIKQLFDDLYRGRTPGLKFHDVAAALGFDALTDQNGAMNVSKIPEVPQFLNRLLSLTTDVQGEVFNAFTERMEAKVEAAIAAGTLDVGMETLKADEVRVLREETVYTDPATGAKTQYVELELTHATPIKPFPETAGIEWLRNEQSGKVWGKQAAGTSTSSSGAVEKRYRMIGTATQHITDAAKLSTAKLEALTPEAARQLWQAENDAKDKTYTTPAHLITGALLPIWDRLSGSTVRVVRTQASNGQRYLGRFINPGDLKDVLRRLNVDSSYAKLAPAELARRIQGGAEVELANGWRLVKSRVANDQRIELVIRSMVSGALERQLTDAGVFMERIQFQQRYFVPTGSKAAEVIAELIKTRPVVNVGAKTLETRTNPTLFRGYADLGHEPVDTHQALADAERISGLYLDLPIELRDDLPARVPARFDAMERVIHINAKAKISRAEAVQGLVEELLHSVDSLASDRTLSAASERLALTGTVGDIALEAVQHVENGGPLTTFLAYPLRADDLSPSVQQAELFARLGALYFGDQNLMREHLPNAYDAYHQLFRVQSQAGGYAGRTVSRKVWFAARRAIQVGGGQRPMGGAATRLPGRDRLRQGAIRRGLEQLRAAANDIFRGTPDGGLVDFRRLETRRLDPAAKAARETFHDFTTTAQQWLTRVGQSDRSISPLMRSINTQYHKAETLAQQGKPQFKQVFDLGQQFISDTTLLAAQAAQLAPNILHQPRSLRDFAGGAKDPDLQAIDQPLNEGTLYGGGNPIAGVRWSDAQLKSRYQLTDRQIALYHEYLDATAESVDIMAKAQIAAHAKTNNIAFDRDMALDDMTALVVERLDDLLTDAHLQLEYASDKNRINDEAADLVEMDRPHEADQLRRDADRQVAALEATIARLEKTIVDVNAIAAHAAQLRAAGYKPLMRFGEHTVTAYDADGKVAFYGMYEGGLLPGSGEAEAKQAAEALRAENPDWTVKTGVLSQQAHKLYAGINLEALQLFADHMDAAAKEPYQEYLRQAVNNRSALKRMIKRQGTPGFSHDARRTLAQFVLSNGRLAAAQYHLTDMRKAAEAIPHEQGDIKDEAVNLHEYLTQPKEEAQKLRGFLFFNYIGGSIASAMVNLTQVPAVTAPYLTQFTNSANVVNELVAAAKVAMQDPAKLGGSLGEALRKAEADGVTAPQEIYQLMAIASNSVFAGAKVARLGLQAWGKLFSTAEQFNRRVTFIAAHRIAEANGQRGQAAFAFAEAAVNDTQFIYNRGNRPNWARGAIGSTLFTFKQFNIAYLELFKRLPAKQRLMMLGVLLVFAGAGGLPFEEDLIDLIDTLGQWLGFATNAKRTIRNSVKSAFGETAGELLLRGVSGALPFDVSARLGMANLVPGTAILKPSEINKGRDIAEAIGPAGSLVQSALDALQALARGHYEKAALESMPVAVRNAYMGAKMMAKGHGEDFDGRKTLDVTSAEAAAKMIGFQPLSLAQFSEAKQGLQQQRNLLTVKQDEINSEWADAIIARDPAALDAVKAKLIAWNRANPDMQLRFNPVAIRKRVLDAQLAGDVRYLKNLPRALREQAREELR